MLLARSRVLLCPHVAIESIFYCSGLFTTARQPSHLHTLDEWLTRQIYSDTCAAKTRLTFRVGRLPTSHAYPFSGHDCMLLSEFMHTYEDIYPHAESTGKIIAATVRSDLVSFWDASWIYQKVEIHRILLGIWFPIEPGSGLRAS